MAHPIGYSTSYNPQSKTPLLLHQLQERYGARLQSMTYEQKIVLRAALANYIANKPVHQPSPHPEEVTLMQGCIESAGADWNVWEADPELCEYVEACESLSESDIEGLIEALTAQIRGGVYASRTEEWVVVSPNY
ncbi:MAG: hypothetical protein ICV55_10905 [Coleofasciculus sp. C3-bin4]|nr:hypothetical protein [Coleofasciculus sp. C3-bin4]